MRDFSYSRQEGNDAAEIETIIRQRRRKIRRQQLIYSIILAIIIGVICVWVYRRTVYIQFDGYMSLDENTFRSGEDIYFLRSYVRVGDLVVPGDTLFSYTIVENFFKHLHNDYEPSIISRHRDLKVQYGLAKQDADVLRVRISELQRQLATGDHNIRLGLSDNHNKMRTEQELAEAQEQLKALERKLRVLQGAIGDAGHSMARLTNNGHGYVRIAHMYDYDLIKKLGMVYYSVATDSAIVARKFVATNELTLRGEPIMSLQGLRAQNNNLVVVAYVMPDEMKHVNYHSEAEIIVNDEISLKGTVMMLGSRTEEIPGELRSTLSRDHTASIVVFDLAPNQNVPFWAITNGVPVTIRINKLKSREPIEGDYIIYNTSSGVYQNTLTHAQHECMLNPEYAKKHLHYIDTTIKDSLVVDRAADSISLVTINHPEKDEHAGKTARKNVKSAHVEREISVADAAGASGKIAVGNAKGPFHIIVASGQNRDGAERQARALRKAGCTYAKVIVSTIDDSGEQYQICISSFRTNKEAEKALKQVKRNKRFHDAWIIYKKMN